MRWIRICEKNTTVVQLLVESLKEIQNGGVGAPGSKPQKDDVGLVYQWSWMEDMEAKSWKPFDPNENFQIELGMNPTVSSLTVVNLYISAYLSQGQKGKMTTAVPGDLNRVKNGFAYEIDFDAMTEVNTKFRATLRPIKREPIKHTPNFAWEIQAGEKGEWIKFGKMENDQVSPFLKLSPLLPLYPFFFLFYFFFLFLLQIELAFFKRSFPVMRLKWRDQPLVLDFQQMLEINYKWKLNRGDVQYENQLRSRNEKYSSLPLFTRRVLTLMSGLLCIKKSRPRR